MPFYKTINNVPTPIKIHPIIDFAVNSHAKNKCQYQCDHNTQLVYRHNLGCIAYLQSTIIA